MKKVSNAKASDCVTCREEFNGSNTFGRWIGGVYVAFSYGEHFPLFVWKDGEWFCNSDRYSVTTSKHRSQLHPNTATIDKTTAELKKMY